jgi:hypothetical protein
MNAIEATIRLFTDPGAALIKEATELRTQSVKENSWVKDGKARLAFVAQAIVSIVATVFAILATILFSIAALCIEGRDAAWEILKGMTWITLIHASCIPTCFIAAFAKHSWDWQSPTHEIAECIAYIQPD